MSRPGERGFTLLEVLVAIMILATALVSLLSLHGRNILVVAEDRDVERATLLAQEVMTRALIDSPFPDVRQESGDFDEDPGFGWALEVSEPPVEELREEVREIEVRVFRKGEGDLARFVTHVRREGPGLPGLGARP